jgi:hypothetical protein
VYALHPCLSPLPKLSLLSVQHLMLARPRKGGTYLVGKRGHGAECPLLLPEQSKGPAGTHQHRWSVVLQGRPGLWKVEGG